jgi:hypothetical protein
MMRFFMILLVFAVAAAFAAPGGAVFADDGDILAPGAYVAEAHPYYKHPVTGTMEDSGQNPGIGQGMTESVLGREALLEVYEDGSVYVTVRFSLMDNIQNIKLAAQKDAGSEYVPAEFAIVKEAMGEGKDAKADIRFGLPGISAIVRAEFFVVAMGRDVIFFMDFSDPVPGEGDFLTTPAPGFGAGDAAGVSEGGSDGEAATTAAASASDETGVTEAGIDSAPTPAGEADTGNEKGGGKMDVKLFIVIAAAIVAAAVVAGVVVSRRKPKGAGR